MCHTHGQGGYYCAEEVTRSDSKAINGTLLKEVTP